MSTHSVSVLYAITCIAEGGSKDRKVERSSKIERTLAHEPRQSTRKMRNRNPSERKWKNGLGRRLTARLGRRLVTVCSARQPGAGPREGAPIQGGVGLYLRLCPTATPRPHFALATSLAHLWRCRPPFWTPPLAIGCKYPVRKPNGKKRHEGRADTDTAVLGITVLVYVERMPSASAEPRSCRVAV